MRAYQLKKTGPPESLTIETLPDPKPGKDEVVVKLETIGLNYAEIQSRRGLYAWAPKRPYTPGMEGYGKIIATGSNVHERQIGEPVIVAAQYGCYAEQVCVPARQALPAMTEFSAAENAALAVNFMTAWVAINRLLRLNAGEKILIHAAAGGVGTAAVQLAHALGAQVYGTVGSDEKRDLVERLGARAVINYRKADFAKEVRKLTGEEGLDAVIEVVGGQIFRKSLKLLKPFGRLVVMGFASLNLNKYNPISWVKTYRSIPRLKIAKMAQHSQMVGASHLGYLLNNPTLLPELWVELVDFTRKHELRPVVGHTLSFEELPAAHVLMESRKSQGKIVLMINAD